MGREASAEAAPAGAFRLWILSDQNISNSHGSWLEAGVNAVWRRCPGFWAGVGFPSVGRKHTQDSLSMPRVAFLPEYLNCLLLP